MSQETYHRTPKAAAVKHKYAVAIKRATHLGRRLSVRGTCEKCGTLTNWVVNVMGRVDAYWCGCD